MGKRESGVAGRVHFEATIIAAAADFFKGSVQLYRRKSMNRYQMRQFFPKTSKWLLTTEELTVN
jgi:hypothetical protein